MSRKASDGTWTRGATNSNQRGSSEDRRRRRKFLLNKFGNGITVKCTHCPAVLTFETVCADRIIPGWKGGRYTQDNIQPSCQSCGSEQGGQMGQVAKETKRAIAGGK